jgi:hypothetical protein
MKLIDCQDLLSSHPKKLPPEDDDRQQVRFDVKELIHGGYTLPTGILTAMVATAFHYATAPFLATELAVV